MSTTKITPNLVTTISASQITGQVTDSQIADVAASKVTGTLNEARVPALPTSRVTNLDSSLSTLTTSVGTKAPTPTSSAGVGQWTRITSTLNTALSLPAGGTWAYFCFYKDNVTNLTGSYDAGVAAGGTQILAAGGANAQAQALVWRIA